VSFLRNFNYTALLQSPLPFVGNLEETPTHGLRGIEL